MAMTATRSFRCSGAKIGESGWVIDPAQLLAAARLLAAPGASPSPSEGQLRRAISTAYYALFHTFLRAGAERFMGLRANRRPGYAILYRGFNHGRMKTICAAVDAPRLSPALERQLGCQAVHPDVRNCANIFLALQGARHRADYDPYAVFTHGDAVKLTDQAELAMSIFARAPEDERSDFLALMLATTRD